MTTSDPRPAADLSAAAREADERRQLLLRYPGEAPEVDYKAAMAFGKNDFSHKLIKQIIALANGGGGTLVIGFKEDSSKRLAPDPDMTDLIAASYDVTKVSGAVTSHVRGSTPVPLRIYQQVEGSVTYPIIEVQEFDTVPYFCAVDKYDDNGRPILKQGALYIRTSRASSEELATPEDWNRLLDLAVTRRQDDLLGRFGDLLRQFGLTAQARGADQTEFRDLFEAWVTEQKSHAERHAREGHRELPGYYLFAYQPEGGQQSLNNDYALLKAAEAAERPNTGWPIGLIPYNFRNSADRKFTEENGLTVIVGQNDVDHFDYWHLQRDGAFFILRIMDEDSPRWGQRRSGTVLFASTTVWRIAEAVDHCIALYRALDLPGTTRLWFAAEYGGLQGRQLTDERHLIYTSAPATRDRVRFERRVTLDQLVADADGMVRDAVKDVLSVFGFFEVPDAFITATLGEYRASNVGH